MVLREGSRRGRGIHRPSLFPLFGLEAAGVGSTGGEGPVGWLGSGEHERVFVFDALVRHGILSVGGIVGHNAVW